MEVRANIKLTNQYVRNVIASFAKSGRDVAKDLMPTTVSMSDDIVRNVESLKDVKYNFKKIKDKLITPPYQDDKSYDGIDDSINKDL